MTAGFERHPAKARKVAATRCRERQDFVCGEEECHRESVEERRVFFHRLC